MDEKELLRRLLTHDKKSVREFYIRHSPRLFNFIRKRVADEKDVEEIAQDTLFAFLDGARDFTGKCLLSTYLCSIAKNKIVDFYRRKRLKRIVFSQLPKSLEPIISDLGDPQKLFDNSLLKERIIVILTNLSPHYARIIKLKYIEGRSVLEIARHLSCSFKSAESVLFRARKAFVKLYSAGEK